MRGRPSFLLGALVPSLSRGQRSEAHREEAFNQQIKPQTEARTRIPPTDEFSRRTQNARPASTERTLAAHSGLISRAPLPTTKSSLKSTEAFRTVYRRGRWARGPSLSLGMWPTTQRRTRIGLRTRRGLKGAATRNRLKRQLRTIVYARDFSLRIGLDIVIVIHPPMLPAQTASLKKELLNLCKHTGALS